MENVLKISTSITGESSVSAQLMGELLEKLADEKSLQVIERNFSSEPIPHLDGDWLQALSTPENERSADQQAKAAFSDRLIAELVAADTLVIGLPMYNFSLPSMLKAWVDHIARAGVTFKYTEEGSVGLLKAKKVYLVAAMGGIHETGATDFLRPYLKLILGFVGLRDIEIISADGLNMGSASRELGLTKARNQITNIASAARGEAIV